EAREENALLNAALPGQLDEGRPFGSISKNDQRQWARGRGCGERPDQDIEPLLRYQATRADEKWPNRHIWCFLRPHFDGGQTDRVIDRRHSRWIETKSA